VEPQNGEQLATIESVDEHLAGKAGVNLTEMSDEDKAEFEAAALEFTDGEAINEALEIIGTAPAFDDVSVSEINRTGVTATVEREFEYRREW
jgi:hypothetical protein